MPRGAKPGERRGGRGKGTLNKATLESLERERIRSQIDVATAGAERTITQAQAIGRKLAKDRLEELTEIFIGAAAYFQPRSSAIGEANQNADWDKFEKWGRLAMDCASKLAPYQSPTFRAIMVSAPPPPREEDKLGNVISLSDPIGAARVYRRIVTSGGGR